MIFQAIHRKLLESNYWKFILFNYFTLLLCFIFPSLIVEFAFDFNPANDNPISLVDNKLLTIFLITIAAPIIETLIFQIVCINAFILIFALILNKNENNRNILIISIVLSAIVFGFAHFYNWIYMAFMLILGIYFGYIYFYCYLKQVKPFYPIAILHSLYNLTVYAIENMDLLWNA